MTSEAACSATDAEMGLHVIRQVPAPIVEVAPPMCPSLREQLINPKQNPLANDAKALCIYLTSPYKDNDDPIDESASVRRLNEREQRVQNAPRSLDITWESPANVPQKVRPNNWVPQWTLWIEAHGAPMWFFGAEATQASERLGTRDFATWVLNCEAATGITFDNIVLDSCFSAVEQIPAGNRTISPARAVSILLPDKGILGYLGKNNSANVTGLVVGATPTALSITQGTALFKKGLCVEGPTHQNLYFTPESLVYSKTALLGEFGVTKSTAHVLGPVPGAANEPTDVTKFPARALTHLKRLDKIWTKWLNKPSFFK